MKIFFKEAGFLDTDIGLSRERFIIIQFSRGSRETETNQIFHLLILTFINFFFTKNTSLKQSRHAFSIVIKGVPEMFLEMETNYHRPGVSFIKLPYSDKT